MQWKLVALSLLLAVGPAGNAKDSEKVPSPPSTALPVLQSTSKAEIPLDDLLDRSTDRSYAFLATLDSAGKPASLLLLEGYTLFLPEVDLALRNESFDLHYAGRQVIIEITVPRDPAPLPMGTHTVIGLQNVEHPTPADEETIKAAQLRFSQVESCDAAMDKDRLIREGNRDEGRNKAEAYKCFQLALSKAPASIAALDGASATCDKTADASCQVYYLAKIVALRPDSYEARERFAVITRTPSDESLNLTELKKILDEDPPPPVQLRALDDLIYRANRAGDTPDEIQYRTKWSEIARRYSALYRKKFDAFYSRTTIVMNDEPLALLLEGAHRYSEAEEIYRRNLSMISVDPIFQKEVEFDDELGLARALAGQGESTDAARVCSKWKLRKEFVAGLSDATYGLASKPVEAAKWDLSCGKEQEGLALLHNEATARPWMYSAYIALRDYYYAHGDVQNALKADGQNEQAHRLADQRTGLGW